jgi:hypothetical protein
MNMRLPAATVALAVLAGSPADAQQIPTPVSHFGFDLGEHRKLADWVELTSYYEKLAETSQRVSVDTLGTTTMGRPFVMLTITSPDNHARLDELHDIQMRLADPRRVGSEEELERLFQQGRTVVLITHGVHATEVGGSQTAARLAHRLASADDPKTLEILENVILLQIPSLNPDGLQWVVDWYEEWVGTEYEGASLPWLYHYYVGHDNNRDWYAFTQDETWLTVTKAHNAWHPHITHDIHQMGGSGARIFFPPYIDPIEHNVDPGIISAVNQIGPYMAAEVGSQGKDGVVINAIYDGFTPARAYQHYHAGARILSETASARLASPVTVDPESIGGGREYDAASPSWNYPNPWKGGEWGLPDIVDYMEAGALALLTNAAQNRRFWLEHFWGLNLRATEGRDARPADQANEAGLAYVLRILTTGDVEVHRAETDFRADGRSFVTGSYVIPMQQPYAAFAQTMLEVQRYPDLREYPGGPPKRPYDVTAHTLGLLMDVESFAIESLPNVDLSDPIDPPVVPFVLPSALRGDDAPRVGLYKSWHEPMEGGWTRWLLDQYGMSYDTLSHMDVAAGDLGSRLDVILFQSQDPDEILEGYRDDDPMPPDYRGGIGEAGAQALREFVRGGGRIVAIEEATDLIIDLFRLPLANPVERLPNQEFYVPGSIVRLDLEEHGLTAGLPSETHGWYWRSSRAFDVGDPTVSVVASYGDGNPVESGWILGPEHLAGQPALVEVRVGNGSVVLFGFQPNYRAQTVATWPLLLNSLMPGQASTLQDAGGQP